MVICTRLEPEIENYGQIPGNSSKIYELIVTYGMKFIMAIVVLIVGLIVIKWITKSHGSHDEKEKCE